MIYDSFMLDLLVSGYQFLFVYLNNSFFGNINMDFSFDGYHGTSVESANEILKHNYSLSIGDDEWLGNGVYFFVTGISSKTIDLAEKWAVAQAWDKSKRIVKYNEYCVLLSNIKVEKSRFLDLTIEEGVEILTYLTKKYEEKIKSIGKKMKYLDGLLLNLARGEGFLPLDVVKGNFYIKFVKERKERINLRTSNCTICVVYNPSENVFSTSIIKTGHIK